MTWGVSRKVQLLSFLWREVFYGFPGAVPGVVRLFSSDREGSLKSQDEDWKQPEEQA